MIRFSDISGNPVMDTSTATTVGKVQAPIIDPVTQQVIGFRVKKSKAPAMSCAGTRWPASARTR